jgi:DMSO reductase anchor subunit
MHPARSLILFTALSGLGFGLLVFLGLGVPSVSGWLAVIYFALAFGLSAAGLVASTFHLGHPERALKAFTQWRSSWLSREAWLASATLVLGAVYAAGIVFFGTKLTLLGWLVSAMSVTTVYATSMIYAQLKTVPRWNHWSTSVIFLGLSLAGGAILTGAIWVALVLLAATAGLQFYAWRLGDQALAQSGSDIASATGLGHIGKVRSFEAPHTGENYLTKEMVYVVARKHAQKLRMIALALAFALPALLLMLPFSHVFAVLAVASHLAGVFTLRWLFFAEAEHVVGLYYGQR